MRALVLIFDACLGVGVYNGVAWEYLYVDDYEETLRNNLGKDDRSRERMEKMGRGVN